MSNYLQITGLTKSYQNKDILKGIDLDIKEGEIFTILGVSGAGKSTLLGCINGITKPDKGSILLNGKDLISIPSNDDRIRSY